MNNSWLLFSTWLEQLKAFCNPDTIELQEVVVKNEHCMFLQIPQEVLVGSGLIVEEIKKGLPESQ